MRAGTHILIGATWGFQLAQVLAVNDPPKVALVAFCAVCGALLPDLDHPRATLRQRLGLMGDVAFGFLRHRGPTHSLLGLALMTLVAMSVHPLYGAAVAVGYASHIVGDLMTRSGTLLFWPAWNEPAHLLPRALRLTTGGRVEKLLAFCILTGFVFLAFSPYLQPLLLRLSR